MYKNIPSESIRAKFTFFFLFSFMGVGWFLSKYVFPSINKLPRTRLAHAGSRCKRPPFDLEEMFSMTALAVIV